MRIWSRAALTYSGLKEIEVRPWEWESWILATGLALSDKTRPSPSSFSETNSHKDGKLWNMQSVY